jgi:hypothetical protein
MPEMRALVTSPDGQWAAARRGRTVTLLAAGAAPPVGQFELDGDDVELAFVGPPNVLIAVTRDTGTKVVLHQPPYLEAVARHDVDGPARIAAITGPRIALVSNDGKQVTILRAAARALATHTLDVGSPVEFAVGIDKNQIVFGLMRKLEVWDAVSGRPMLRLQLQLPPPPRIVGAATGHIWATRPNSDELYVYRLSDGRPFRHYAGAPIEDVICHPASPLLVLVTPRGLVRMHCFAQSLSYIEDAPWAPGDPVALAQLVVGDDISLLGLGDAAEPWRVAISGAGAPALPSPPEPATETVGTAADRRHTMPASQDGAPSRPHESPTTSRPLGRATWRETLATFGTELVRGGEPEIPVVAIDTELGDLAHRLALSSAARRALVTLYALHLIGEPALAIARLSRAIGDWTEPLGQGELGSLAMLRRKRGTVALHAAVTDLLDGVAPAAIRIVGGPPTTPRAGTFRVSRDGRSDAAIESELAAQLGRIGVVEGRLPRALLDARLHGATAVAITVPAERPKPWPLGAGLVLVLYGNPTAWLADVPALDATVS